MNCFSLDDFTTDEIMGILHLANDFAFGKKVDYRQEKVVTFMFYEPSTRTHYSYEKAALNLGCLTQNLDVTNSSVQKGESLYDTCKFFESIGTDCLVIRHSQNRYYDEIKGKLDIPVLSGGDGTGDHPSQSLLDLLTIYQEYRHFEGLKVVIVGDIKHSRVAHSNFKVMRRLGMEVYTSGPLEYKEEGMNYVDFEEIIPQVDIVMLLSVQHERHEEDMSITKEEYLHSYGMTMERVNQMKENAIIMHPAPFNRNVEIADDVVECEKSRIFKQMTNGVYVRMALINMALGDR